MKNVILFTIIFLLPINQFLTAQDYQNSQDSGDLIIIVNGLNNSKGDVQLGLFNSEESFNGEQRKFKGVILKVENKMVIWEVKNIPFGEYAIKTFHDEDQDDEIDTNFIGIPTERYGFSNNAKGLFGPPSFEKAKFHFDKHNMQITINLN